MTATGSHTTLRPAKLHLAEARRRADLTQQQLADRVGINRVQVAKYESGAQTPSVDTAARIAKALATSVEDVFAGGEPPPRGRAAAATRLDRLEARVSALEAQIEAIRPG